MAISASLPFHSIIALLSGEIKPKIVPYDFAPSIMIDRYNSLDLYVVIHYGPAIFQYLSP
jgi:hypothetical protein